MGIGAQHSSPGRLTLLHRWRDCSPPDVVRTVSAQCEQKGQTNHLSHRLPRSAQAQYSSPKRRHLLRWRAGRLQVFIPYSPGLNLKHDSSVWCSLLCLWFSSSAVLIPPIWDFSLQIYLIAFQMPSTTRNVVIYDESFMTF